MYILFDTSEKVFMLYFILLPCKYKVLINVEEIKRNNTSEMFLKNAITTCLKAIKYKQIEKIISKIDVKNLIHRIIWFCTVPLRYSLVR